MNIEATHLFVYGSLRVGFKDPAYSYLSKYFHLIGEGTVKGKFYFNGSTPVAISAEDNHFINGDLYELNNEEDLKWVMVQLDDYEGLNVEAGQRPLYKRDLVSVLINGKYCMSWIYWFNGNTDNMIELEAAEVSKYLHQQKK